MKTPIQKLLETTKDLSGLYLESADFAKMDLTGVIFNGSNLTGANFEGAKLHSARFEHANLFSVNFNNADLKNVHFNYARLVQANFENCNLHEACLQQANLTHAYIREKVIQVGPVINGDYVTYFIERNAIESPWFTGTLEDLKGFATEEEDFICQNEKVREEIKRTVKILEACK